MAIRIEMPFSANNQSERNYRMNDHSILDSAYSWRRLVVSILTSTVFTFGMWSIIIFMPEVRVDMGMNRAEVSFLYTLTMIGFAAGNVVIGLSVDRYGIVRPLWFSVACIVLGYYVAGSSQSVYQLWIGQTLLGFGTGAGFGPLVADLSHWFIRRRGIAVAMAASGNYLSGVVLPYVLAVLPEDADWRFSYMYLAVLVLVTMLPLSLLLLRRLPVEAEQVKHVRQIGLKTVDIPPGALQLMLVVAAIACCVAMSMPQVHIVSMCVDLGYGPVTGEEMLSVMLLSGIASRMISGVIADKLGGVRTALIGSGLQCLALVLYLPSDALISLYVVSFIFGLSQGGIVPSYAIIVREYLPAKEAATRVGMVMMAATLGMAIGGWMSGWIYDLTGSYQMAFLNGIGWNILNLLILATILWRSRQRMLVHGGDHAPQSG